MLTLTFIIVGGIAFFTLVYFFFRDNPRELEDAPEDLRDAFPRQPLEDDATPIQQVPVAAAAVRQPRAGSKRRRATRNGRSGWYIDDIFFDDLVDALFIADYLMDYEEEPHFDMDTPPEPEPLVGGGGEFGGGGASGDFNPVSSPPAYDPPSTTPSYDSGGSSYDSGGYDSGDSDSGGGGDD